MTVNDVGMMYSKLWVLLDRPEGEEDHMLSIAAQVIFQSHLMKGLWVRRDFLRSGRYQVLTGSGVIVDYEYDFVTKFVNRVL